MKYGKYTALLNAKTQFINQLYYDYNDTIDDKTQESSEQIILEPNINGECFIGKITLRYRIDKIVTDESNKPEFRNSDR